jgi:hypothetical protein
MLLKMLFLSVGKMVQHIAILMVPQLAVFNVEKKAVFVEGCLGIFHSGKRKK